MTETIKITSAINNEMRDAEMGPSESFGHALDEGLTYTKTTVTGNLAALKRVAWWAGWNLEIAQDNRQAGRIRMWTKLLNDLSALGAEDEGAK